MSKMSYVYHEGNGQRSHEINQRDITLNSVGENARNRLSAFTPTPARPSPTKDIRGAFTSQLEQQGIRLPMHGERERSKQW